MAATWKQDVGNTGIDKRPASGRVRVFDHHVDGDTIADRSVHGGPDQAVYAYAREDAAWWSAQLGREVAPGAFGENFSTSGLDVTGAVIGERWAVGSAVFEVSCPRLPCRTFAGFWDVPRLIKWFTEVGRPGTLLGAFSKVEWPEEQFSMRPGETLVAITDGVTDTVGRDDERFGIARLQEILADAQNDSPMRIRDRLLAALEDFQVGAQADDTAIVIMRFTRAPAKPEPGGRVVTANVPV